MPDEIHQRLIQQDVPGLRKRWFQGERLDLAIWQNPVGDVVHFQLILDIDQIIDYESGRGMLTGKVDQARGTGMRPMSPVILAEKRLNTQILRAAFHEFVEAPPMSQKRVLSFVARTLNAALTNPEKPQWPDSRLPPGQDSAMMDLGTLESGLLRMKEARQREGMIERLLARFRGKG